VGIFSVVPLDDGAGHFAVDPVCKMAVDPDRAVGRLLLDEEAFHFCSFSCAAP
jgi:YHS domain-containing protein